MLNLSALLTPTDKNQSRELIDLLVDKKIEEVIVEHFGKGFGSRQEKEFFKENKNFIIKEFHLSFYGQNKEQLEKDVAQSLSRYELLTYELSVYSNSETPAQNHLTATINLELSPEVKQKISLEKAIKPVSRTNKKPAPVHKI